MTPHMPPASAASEPPPAVRADRLADRLPQQKHEWAHSTPFRHVVIDGFVPPAFATAPSRGGKCVKENPPVFNRVVIFETDKTSFHGHPKEWNAPEGIHRRSVALYYYTVERAEGKAYDDKTDFQNVSKKALPT